MTSASRPRLHDRGIIIDGTCPLLNSEEHIDWWIEGGVTVAIPTVGGFGDTIDALETIGRWHELIDRRSDLTLLRAPEDIFAAKQQGKLGIIFHFQGSSPIGRDLHMIRAFWELGVRMIQLTYNTRDFVGDGCEEPTDAGLSRFGAAVVRELNKQGIVVDCSHTGDRTTLEAIEISVAPVVCSHSNARAVRPSARNVPDEVIDAIARSGGLLGINGSAGFVSHSARSTLDEFIDHIDYIVGRVGTDHVGLGIDYWEGMALVASAEEARKQYDEFVAAGLWQPETYPAPPLYYPSGLDTPREIPNLTSRLLERGYAEEDVLKIMGGNWIRVFKAAWSGRSNPSESEPR